MNVNKAKQRFYDKAAGVVEIYFFEDGKFAKVFKSECKTYAAAFRHDTSEYQFSQKQGKV